MPRRPSARRLRVLRMANRSGGFTLIEIMLVVGLVGIIAATALAPLVFTVDSLGAAQKSWNESDRQRLAAERIFTDVRSAVPNQAFQSVKIIHKSGLSSAADDRLLVWSAAPAREGRGVCLVVYRVIAATAFTSQKGGLYRWLLGGVQSGGAMQQGGSQTALTSADQTLSSDAEGYLSNDLKLSADETDRRQTPLDTDTDSLRPEDGKLVLANVDGLELKVLLDKEWTDEYEGFLPQALKVTLSSKDKTYVHEEWFPQVGAQ